MCQLLATLGPPALDDLTPVTCGHSSPEPVGSFALNDTWLECAFHALNESMDPGYEVKEARF